MATNGKSNGSITWAGLKAWIPFIITVATLLVSLGTYKGLTERYFHQVDVNTGRLDKVEGQYIDTQVKLARIETDLAYVRATLDKLVTLHTEK